ncbi:HyaD/HybD family hydrogenase maturation endopeptidase [Sulfurovum sp. XGS-02]|uniref:HyaD/HybD family hydrogenase maturation endopeptidase n=1 Tax=Sulfurovum sp. XGS-02 TaxID=2925411 RepID=UPI0020522677|nr:HyaD/HybD family hydrogenase maturation endopeptidase [Sulfurovum sp. XGS-02]UPT77905.1 HyaD/HybD family hydrogenase maturation endopeptidase [Sulfurovum sp. XGS-02]
MVILGIGNVLQKDDGLGVYAASYLNENYIFSKEIQIINGGVEGIHLLNVFMENDHILILDSIDLNDDPSSIYAIPSEELSGHGLNSGGAHEIGVLQCLDMLELQGKPVPQTMVLGIIPFEVTFDIALSKTITEAFESYIDVALQYLEKHGINHIKKETVVTLEEIINKAKDPSGIMI